MYVAAVVIYLHQHNRKTEFKIYPFAEFCLITRCYTKLKTNTRMFFIKKTIFYLRVKFIKMCISPQKPAKIGIARRFSMLADAASTFKEYLIIPVFVSGQDTPKKGGITFFFYLN